ncbi:MAG: sulfatase-like hydrolase/transferase [Clostridia bacterium]|nr:sulfatase-like hydrolase/transferase [Clostridia bacterium]
MNELKRNKSNKTVKKDVEKNDSDIIQNTIVQEQKENKKTISRLIEKVLQLAFQTRLFVLLTGIVLLTKTILFYKVTMFTHKSLEWENIYMSACFIDIILTIPMFLKGKARIIVSVIINFLISILLMINEIYYSFSSGLVSVSQISNLQYGKEISEALPNLVNVKQSLYVLDIIIILVIYFIKKKKIRQEKYFSIVPGFAYLVIMLLIITNIKETWLVEAQKHPYNKVLQIEASSIYGYHILDIKNNLNMKKNVKYKTTEKMLAVYNELMDEYDEKYKLQYDFSGIAKDKNVIIVQLESVQNFVVNRTINGKEITPNLNEFLRENIEFTNMQNQSYTTTADSEHTFMNSLYPLENGMSFAQYSSNDYNNIFKNFKNSEYTTTYIHGNNGAFWNRQAVYSRLPIDNLYFDNVFDENVERINNYVADEQVYKKIVEDIKHYENKFFVNIVTASSHTAFELNGIENKENKVSIDVGDEYRGIYFGNYLEAVNYADYAFGIFINELKEANLYDDTVILVYGDHAGLQMYNWEMQDFIKETRPLNDIQTQINYSNILCGLKIPGVNPMKINKPTSKLDIKPTIMEICGIEDEFSLGRSMFSTKNFVCINNGKIITDKYFYDGDWYSIATGEQLDLSSMPEETANELNYYCNCLQEELDISLSINIMNLLKNFVVENKIANCTTY